jgi:hypothetical protein
MNTKTLMIFALGILLLSSCSDDYLNTSSPSNTDDEFVSSTPNEAFKILSRCYALYRSSATQLYDWNDHYSSDIEYYPENNSANNCGSRNMPELIPCDWAKSGFNTLYNVISYTRKCADLIESKQAFQEDVAAERKSDWTHLYGEAITFWAMCYFDLLKHFGDVPYGYENAFAEDYELGNRFDLYDMLISALKKVEPLMYSVGENKITAQRFNRTFACALLGRIAIYSGGYQAIRTDMQGLYGDIQFTTIGTDAARKAAYVRPVDYMKYMVDAETYLAKALNEAKGSTHLITTDERSYAHNPFQRHFQYLMDLLQSPEAIMELAQKQTEDGRLYSYDFGRGCNGGNNTSPNKVFGAIRMTPGFYYGGFSNDDPRRDVSATITGFDGKGNEVLFNFTANSKTDGGICFNKYDICRQTPYFYGGQGKAGFSVPMMRVADVVLMLAEVKAELGKEGEAIALVNQIRERAFNDVNHNLSGLSGEVLLDAIFMERKLEMFGEGTLRYDMVRSGKFSQQALAARNDIQALVNAVNSQGYYEFANGNQFPAYIWSKKVPGAKLTYDCDDENDPVEFPGWRGILDFKALDMSVTGTDHNVAVKGLFKFIEEGSAEAQVLVEEGYVKTSWGETLAKNIDPYLYNIFPGISSVQDIPLYFWPIPFETIKQSKGKVTNGYGMVQQ